MDQMLQPTLVAAVVAAHLVRQALAAPALSSSATLTLTLPQHQQQVRLQ
jgi:hypothetical protein